MIDGPLICVQHPPSGPRPTEIARAQHTFGGVCHRQRLVVDQAPDRRRHGVGILRIDEDPRIADDFRQRAAIAGDDGDAGGHRFEYRNAEAFVEGWLHEQARALVQRAAIGRLDISNVPHPARERRTSDAIQPDSRRAGCFRPRC